MSVTNGLEDAAGRLFAHIADEEVGRRARAFCERLVRPVGDEIDASNRYPVELVDAAAVEGWNSYLLPRQYGGNAGHMVDMLAVYEELAVGSAALCVSLLTNLQTQRVIEQFGSDSLKDRVLPRYRSGLRGSYALTEHAHGSDIRSVDTTATRDGDGWFIEGTKAFVTGGSEAQIYVILAQTDVGVSTFLVERDSEGIEIRESSESVTFGLRNGPHADVVLKDVHVPFDALIGEEGRGLKQVMTVLAGSRIIAGGISLGVARAAFEDACRYATDRRAFGSSILEFQGIQWYFADHLAQIDAARLLCYRAAQEIDRGGDIARMSSEAKLLACATATKVAETAMQVCGAHGTRLTSSFGRYIRDAKTYEIGGGSAEVLKNTVFKAIASSL